MDVKRTADTLLDEIEEIGLDGLLLTYDRITVTDHENLEHFILKAQEPFQKLREFVDEMLEERYDAEMGEEDIDD